MIPSFTSVRYLHLHVTVALPSAPREYFNIFFAVKPLEMRIFRIGFSSKMKAGQGLVRTGVCKGFRLKWSPDRGFRGIGQGCRTKHRDRDAMYVNVVIYTFGKDELLLWCFTIDLSIAVSVIRKELYGTAEQLPRSSTYSKMVYPIFKSTVLHRYWVHFNNFWCYEKVSISS